MSRYCFSCLPGSRLPYVRKKQDIVRIVLLLQVGRLSHRGTCCPHNAIPTAGKGQRDQLKAVRKRKSVAETENSMRSAESENMAGYDITSFVAFGSASVSWKRIRFLCGRSSCIADRSGKGNIRERESGTKENPRTGESSGVVVNKTCYR